MYAVNFFPIFFVSSLTSLGNSRVVASRYANENAIESGVALRLLVVVDDTFEFQDGTLHSSPLVAIAALEGVRAGDPLELRRPDGTTIHTTLYGLDWPSPMRGEMGFGRAY
jgi:hypothetical protein